MTLEQLLMFNTVALAGSLKAASDKLHKTQPAISQSIKQLESQLDLILFDRQGYRLALTQEGRKLLQYAQRVLNEAQEMRQVAKHLAKGNEASITLAFEASFNLARILPMLEQTQNEFPHTQIILKQEYLTGALEALNQGEADIAISAGGIEPIRSSHFELAYLFSGNLLDVASPRLLSRHPTLSHVRELVNEYQIVIQDTGTGTANIEFGVQAGQRRWYVNDFYTKKMLIQSGMGWGKLPYYLVEQALADGSLQPLEMRERQNLIQLDYYVMRPPHSPLGPVAQALWENLVQLAAKQSV
ncbi:transcriptional regulator, LysR family [Shewanella sp. MR-4]|uniref:LysR family transcriptional regulator n=1 Tax=Shewanella sp. (strain MR-4) TaxID=60480 RepID=UPI00005E4D0A|nr:LysR family transcriptional regulator [Shewanella sp. MR-4]ABI38690.1 transcriptional regulator, LysR family [Shewanella sp. MR-4]